MNFAEDAKLRGTCPRRQVGSVLVKDSKVVGTGYNGAPSGVDHCEDVGCIMENGHDILAVHAESNAIANANCDLRGATVYLTTHPCLHCLKLLRIHGIKRIVYREDYPYSKPEKKVFKKLKGLFEWRKYEKI
jgi:dCMP deaminase